MADSFIRSGASKYALIIGVERLTDMTNRSDPVDAFLFADGAGAAVIGPSDSPGIGPVVWGSVATRLCFDSADRALGCRAGLGWGVDPPKVRRIGRP